MSLQDTDTGLLTGTLESPVADPRAHVARGAREVFAPSHEIFSAARPQAVRGSFLHTLSLRHAGPRRLHLLRSRYGHDAFLKEPVAIASIIRSTLAECRGEIA